MKWTVALASMLMMNLSHAKPITLDFEELEHAAELQGTGDQLISKGYLFRYFPAAGEPYPVGFQTVGPTWRYNGRSAAVNPNSCGATVLMTGLDNNPFDLQAIDLAPLNGDPDVSVRFEGTTVYGEKVVLSVELRVDRGWQRIRFPGQFNRLTSVSWQQGDCLVNKPHMFDNISVRQWNR